MERTDSLPSKRIPELDGIRGLAILLILVWHYFAVPLLWGPILGSYHPLANATLGWLWSGVDLFFVLSGFLIGRILLEQRGAPRYFRVFYLRRVARTFPLYFLSLALFAALFWLSTGPAMGFFLKLFGNPRPIRWLFADPMPMWSYLTFSQNFFMAFQKTDGPNWLGITWSLAIEEQFYLILPILIRFSPIRLLPFLLAGGCVLAWILRIQLGGSYVFLLMPCRMDSLFLGVLVAYLVREPRFLDTIRRYKSLLSGGIVALMVAMAIWLKPLDFNSFQFGWLAILWAVFLLIVLSGDSLLVRLLRVPWLVRLGAVSYGVYLFHQPINGLAHGLLLHRTPYQITGVEDLLISLGALVLTLALASLLHHGIETPFIRLGHRLSFSGQQQPGIASP